MPGSMHQYNGQEAIAAGVCTHLNRDDYVTGAHRGHGHCIAKGADLNAVMAEMRRKATGCCRGMGGSMHIADFGVGMLGANAIVAAGIPIAVGDAWTCQYLAKASSLPAVGQAFSLPTVGQVANPDRHGLTICRRRPAAHRRGLFRRRRGKRRGLSRGAEPRRRLDPARGLCLREQSSTGSPRITAARCCWTTSPTGPAACGMPGVTADGMDVAAVSRTAGKAVRRARGGGGPTLLEYKTYRYMGHSPLEASNSRTKEEVAQWKERDPLPRFRQQLVSDFHAPESRLSAIEDGIARGIRSGSPVCGNQSRSEIPRITGNTSFFEPSAEQEAATGGRWRVKHTHPAERAEARSTPPPARRQDHRRSPQA